MRAAKMSTAIQLVHDVLADRGPRQDGGVFRMCAVRPNERPAIRQSLVARFGHLVPPGTTMADAPKAAAVILALLRGAQ